MKRLCGIFGWGQFSSAHYSVTANILFLIMMIHQIQIILNDGEVSVDQAGASDRTALHRAAGANHVEACKVLIEGFGANVDKKDRSGRTPLHWAAISGHSKTVEYLIDHGADVYSLNKRKATPLHNCAQEGNEKTADAIIKRTNDKLKLFNALDSDDKRAADLAKESGHKLMRKLLKEAGDPNVKGSGCIIS